jgi:hypothetical protein
MRGVVMAVDRRMRADEMLTLMPPCCMRLDLGVALASRALVTLLVRAVPLTLPIGLPPNILVTLPNRDRSKARARLPCC